MEQQTVSQFHKRVEEYANVIQRGRLHSYAYKLKIDPLLQADSDVSRDGLVMHVHINGTPIAIVTEYQNGQYADGHVETVMEWKKHPKGTPLWTVLCAAEKHIFDKEKLITNVRGRQLSVHLYPHVHHSVGMHILQVIHTYCDQARIIQEQALEKQWELRMTNTFEEFDQKVSGEIVYNMDNIISLSTGNKNNCDRAKTVATS